MTNHNHAWKEFKANEVSHSMAHYLVTLHDLHHDRGYARVSDVAKELDVRKGTVSVQMRHLKEKGFVTEDENKFLQLTPTGQTVARQVIYNRATIIQFLHKVLEIDREAAEIDACKIEHLLSPETGHQILALVQLLLSDDPSAKALLAKLKTMEDIPEEISGEATARRPGSAANRPGSSAKVPSRSPRTLNEKPKVGDRR